VLDLPNCYNGFSDAYDKSLIIGLIDEQIAVDAVPVVRCKDCNYCIFQVDISGFEDKPYTYYNECTCHHWDIDQTKYPIVDECDFCSHGERGTDEAD